MRTAEERQKEARKIWRLAHSIGIETLEGLGKFIDQEERQGETLPEALERYAHELGADTLARIRAKRNYEQGKAKARAAAIDWQNKQADRVQSWGDYAERVAELEKLAKRFGLVEEFKQNGII